MKWFQRKKESLADDEMTQTPSTEVEFKPFRETYTIVTFNMVVGMLYPNPDTDRKRAIGIGVIIFSLTPLCAMASLDVWHSWQRRDIINIIRHSTVIGPLCAVPFKMILLYIRRVEAYDIITTLDADYARYNTLPESHKAIARKAIRDTQFYSEKCLAWIVGIAVMVFPATAAVLNVYNYIFKSEPTFYMIHDLEKPFSEPEDRFKSPFFEFMFVYMLCCSLFFILSFAGYDPFFGVTINHLCLKIELLCKELDDAMLERDASTMFEKMVNAIKEHNEFFRVVALVQKTFNIWLGLIFLATMAQICNCMYQVIEGYGIDIRYLMFMGATIVHIYLPCRYAAKLKVSAAEVANRVYCSGWERAADRRARKMIAFMIARAQVPLNITAFNMVNFDMELFVSMLQTSYSLFTLLRS